jgi:hypothetical protein
MPYLKLHLAKTLENTNRMGPLEHLQEFAKIHLANIVI